MPIFNLKPKSPNLCASMLSQVEQILDIFDVGEDRDDNDQINFSQFHSKVCCNNEEEKI